MCHGLFSNNLMILNADRSGSVVKTSSPVSISMYDDAIRSASRGSISYPFSFNVRRIFDSITADTILTILLNICSPDSASSRLWFGSSVGTPRSDMMSYDEDSNLTDSYQSPDDLMTIVNPNSFLSRSTISFVKNNVKKDVDTAIMS